MYRKPKACPGPVLSYPAILFPAAFFGLFFALFIRRGFCRLLTRRSFCLSRLFFVLLCIEKIPVENDPDHDADGTENNNRNQQAAHIDFELGMLHDGNDTGNGCRCQSDDNGYRTGIDLVVLLLFLFPAGILSSCRSLLSAISGRLFSCRTACFFFFCLFFCQFRSSFRAFPRT